MLLLKTSTNNKHVLPNKILQLIAFSLHHVLELFESSPVNPVHPCEFDGANIKGEIGRQAGLQYVKFGSFHIKTEVVNVCAADGFQNGVKRETLHPQGLPIHGVHDKRRVCAPALPLTNLEEVTVFDPIVNYPSDQI